MSRHNPRFFSQSSSIIQLTEIDFSKFPKPKRNFDLIIWVKLNMSSMKQISDQKLYCKASAPVLKMINKWLNDAVKKSAIKILHRLHLSNLDKELNLKEQKNWQNEVLVMNRNFNFCMNLKCMFFLLLRTFITTLNQRVRKRTLGTGVSKITLRKRCSEALFQLFSGTACDFLVASYCWIAAFGRS